jgi:hypothetical protein
MTIPRDLGALHPVAREGLAPDEFARAAPAVRVITLELTTARILDEIKITGNFLWAIDSSGADVAVTVFFNTQGTTGIPFAAGLSIAGQPFNKIYVTHAAQAGQTITLVYGVESPGGFRLTNKSTTIQTVQVARPTTFTGNTTKSVGLTAVEMITTSGTRREAIVNYISAGTGKLYVGHSNAVTTANGIEILPGGTLILTCTAAIWGISDTAAQDVRVAEILD